MVPYLLNTHIYIQHSTHYSNMYNKTFHFYTHTVYCIFNKELLNDDLIKNIRIYTAKVLWKTADPRVNFEKRFAYYEIHTLTLCLSYHQEFPNWDGFAHYSYFILHTRFAHQFDNERKRCKSNTSEPSFLFRREKNVKYMNVSVFNISSIYLIGCLSNYIR